MVLQLDRVYVTNVYVNDKGAGYLELTDGGESKLKLNVPNYRPDEWSIFKPLKVVARVTFRIFDRNQSIRVDQHQVELLEAA